MTTRTTTTVGQAMVLDAITDLHDGLSHWPTAQDLAEYFRVPRETVEQVLDQLNAAGVIRPLTRDGRPIWKPRTFARTTTTTPKG